MAPSVFLAVFILLVSAAGRGVGQDCNTTLTCTEVGYFRRCEHFCDTQYFTCEKVDKQAILSTCPFGLVFDVNPNNTVCTLFENCSAEKCYTYPTTGCTENSNEPICPTCQQTFIECISGSPPAQKNCGDGMVFNPIPSYPGCIPINECPCTDDNC